MMRLIHVCDNIYVKMEKARPTKYISRKKVKGKWEYTYADKKESKRSVIISKPKNPLTEKDLNRWQQLNNGFSLWDDEIGDYTKSRELTKEERYEKESYEKKHESYLNEVKEFKSKEESKKEKKKIKNKTEESNGGLVTKEKMASIVQETLKNIKMPHWADTVAIRYDSFKPKVGQELSHSISNIDRDDTRDYPEYDKNADKMSGTSAFLIFDGVAYDDELNFDEVEDNLFNLSDQKKSVYSHCSIIIGRKVDEFSEDEGEVVLDNATVVKNLW